MRDTPLTRPDIVLLASDWRDRALLRAQLIEDGHEVVAIDRWPLPRLYRRPDMRPRVMVVDLRGLPAPRDVLEDVRYVLPPERVLVITSLGTLNADEVRAMGFPVIERPSTVGEIAAAAGALVRSVRRASE